MIRVLGGPKRLCDGVTRRELLQVGTLGLLGAGVAVALKPALWPILVGALVLFSVPFPTRIEAEMLEPIKARGDRAVVDDVVTNLATARMDREIDPNPAKPADFGLEPPEAEAEKFIAAINSRPPILLVHGDRDELIPVQELFHAANGLSTLGLTVAWHISAGIGHGIDQGGLRYGAEFIRKMTQAG